jgi:hypothetical protein
MSYIRQEIHRAITTLSCSGDPLYVRLEAAGRVLVGLYPVIPDDRTDLKKEAYVLHKMFIRSPPAEPPTPLLDGIAMSVRSFTRHEKREMAQRICGLIMLLEREDL